MSIPKYVLCRDLILVLKSSDPFVHEYEVLETLPFQDRRTAEIRLTELYKNLETSK
jgi:hypothetical protein